jgi:hypothetical protein
MSPLSRTLATPGRGVDAPLVQRKVIVVAV